ncbi:MAG TPA: RNA polymerase sigma factor [Candidatus Binatia bacterium]|nr:RNA polymerase sigma factor [Candidatus Binatia bacterium]
MGIEESAAIQRCQNGDVDAFGELYDMYVKKIYDFIYYRTGHKQTAEDLTSVTFTKAFQNIHTFKGSQGLFSSWLYRIARNTVIDNARTSKPTVDLEAAANAKARDNVAGEAEVKDRLDQVKKYLDQLSEEQREIVVMRLWDELSYAEISALTGKTEGNCKVIFSRVMQKMQKELIPYLLYLLLFLTN